METLTYTIPSIVNPNGEDTYIFFSVKYKGKTHKFKTRKDINRIKDKRIKKAECEALRAAREQWLKDGWNPVIDKEFKLRAVVNRRERSGTAHTFETALNYSLEQRKPTLSSKTHLDYFNIQNIAIDYAKKIGIAELPIGEIRRSDIVALLDHIRTARKWSNHRYNAYHTCLRAAFSDLCMREIIESNPCFAIERKPVAESNFFAPFTAAEKKKLYTHLHENHRALFRVMLLVYHCGIRPKEITHLQVKDFDLDAQQITITPDIERENSKTLFMRHVPINNHLMPFIEEMNIKNYPPDYYVFGTPFQYGSAAGKSWMKEYNRDHKKEPGEPRGAFRSDYLMPHPFKTKRDTITKLWHAIIIKGLKINKHLYAAKHTGADDKINADIPLEVLKTLYGHRAERMTETYAKGLKARRARIIINTSPDFI